MIIDDVDFVAMYRRHVELSGRPPKSADDWDDRAKKLDGNVMDSTRGYTREFIRKMDLTDAHSLLDIGCGPGTIALAVADQLDQVVGLDYSPVMLERVRDHARTMGLANVQTCLRSWDDDWTDVPQCDIVVASRSSMVPDMAQALVKMTGHARQRCYMTHRVGGQSRGGGHSRGGGDAKGGDHSRGRGDRKTGLQPAFPDYIYIVNILYSMGLNPRLDYVELPGQGDESPRWAFIAWDVPKPAGE